MRAFSWAAFAGASFVHRAFSKGVVKKGVIHISSFCFFFIYLGLPVQPLLLQSSVAESSLEKAAHGMQTCIHMQTKKTRMSLPKSQQKKLFMHMGIINHPRTTCQLLQEEVQAGALLLGLDRQKPQGLIH